MAKKTTKKRRSRSSIEKDLDRVFSIFIRLREANDEGITRCYSCGKRDLWVNMDCGHYISRVHRSTRWDELNCHVQCKRCNIFLHGNYPQYALNLIKEFGTDVLEELSKRKHKTEKFSTIDLEEMIMTYRSLNESKLIH